jgi:hypothetical protein
MGMINFIYNLSFSILLLFLPSFAFSLTAEAVCLNDLLASLALPEIESSYPFFLEKMVALPEP